MMFFCEFLRKNCSGLWCFRARLHLCDSKKVDAHSISMFSELFFFFLYLKHIFPQAPSFNYVMPNAKSM